MNKEQLARQIAFFGEKGQDILNNQSIVIVGVGGVGSHIAQQLAFLNVAAVTLIDDDILEETNCNRLIGYTAAETEGTNKVEIIGRHIRAINPDVKVTSIKENLLSVDSFESIKKASFVFSCVDNDGARVVINELCVAYEIPFIDAASDILPDQGEYGGHVISVIDSSRCLYCLGEIDSDEARKFLLHPDARKDEAAIYGIDKILLKGGGPSVVSINGTIASLAVTEFMLHITGIRTPNFSLKYMGKAGVVRRIIEHDSSNCYYCKSLRGLRDKAEIESSYIIE